MEEKNTLKYCKVRKVKSPVRGTEVAAGIDLFIPEDIDSDTFADKCRVTNCFPEYTLNDEYFIDTIVLQPGESVMIPSGLKFKIPDGYCMALMNKSGVGAKKQLDRIAELIDQDYLGEVHINLVNNGRNAQVIKAGDKIIQGVVIPVNYCQPEEVESAEILYAESNSARGEGGFGSTGTR